MFNNYGGGKPSIWSTSRMPECACVRDLETKKRQTGEWLWTFVKLGERQKLGAILCNKHECFVKRNSAAKFPNKQTWINNKRPRSRPLSYFECYLSLSLSRPSISKIRYTTSWRAWEPRTHKKEEQNSKFPEKKCSSKRHRQSGRTCTPLLSKKGIKITTSKMEGQGGARGKREDGNFPKNVQGKDERYTQLHQSAWTSRNACACQQRYLQREACSW